MFGLKFGFKSTHFAPFGPCDGAADSSAGPAGPVRPRRSIFHKQQAPPPPWHAHHRKNTPLHVITRRVLWYVYIFLWFGQSGSFLCFLHNKYGAVTSLLPYNVAEKPSKRTLDNIGYIWAKHWSSPKPKAWRCRMG